MNARPLWSLLAMLAFACTRPAAGPVPTLVFAAASLTAPFQALGEAFERGHPDAKVDLHFAGTPQLVMQVREGAPADVFASADESNMQRIVDAGTTVGTPRIFARNRLAIAVAAGNPRQVTGLHDLARSELKVGLCAPEVPAGRYARAALRRAGVAERSVSDEPSVKALVSKVELGEVDAAIVYATDVRGRGVDAVAIPEAHEVVTSYPIVALGSGRSGSLGAAFVDFVLSSAGQRVLAEHGLLPP